MREPAPGRHAVRFIFLLLICACASLAQGQSRPAPQTSTKNPHGNIAIPCENCHTFTSWKPIRRVPEFDHNKTTYPLRGMHEKVQCVECHVKLVFTNVGTKCADCHADIHRRQMGANCEQCHTVQGWNVSVQAIQNHQNRFPLLGAHAAVDCDSCHKSAAVGQFQGLSTQCYSCHAKDFQGVTNPNHVASQFSTTCETCHSMNTWLDAKFDHALTGFPLTGSHATVPCVSCHVNNNYNLTAANTACAACHMTDFQSTTNPNHVTGGFATTCQTCHTTTAWQPATFDHNATGFPLTGAHVTVACAACHVNNNYNLTAANTTCAACHMTDFQNTTNPNHVQSNFATTCQTCHTTTAWQPATFDHSTTGFPLTGAHVNVACLSCHVNNNYNLTASNAVCSACHMTDFQGTTNPNHSQSGIPTTCQVCHTTTAWQPATFDHSTTGFPLTGAHVSVACTSCHVNNNYNLTSANTACSACHMTDFQGTTNPNHAQSGIPTTCQVCHTTTAWQPATFDHSTTGFPLTGAHVSVACLSCHVNNNYNLTSANTACSACHMTDFQNATSPNHVQSSFPNTCQTCHTTTAWQPAAFDHSTTGFTLTGAHVTVPCISCHVNNNYNLTSANTTCSACHMTDFQGTTDPNHVAAAFSTTCSTCHTTTAWTGATFNHTTTGFALAGAHVTVDCNLCHVSNNYSLTAANTTCVSCHLTDYNTALNPVNHVQGGFPTTCATCHDVVAWTDGTFNHATTGFTLTGAHVTVPCLSCHVNSNYALTSANTACSACHMTDYQGTTNPSHVAAAFPTDCSVCHTTTTWTGATFNHATTGWALTGTHLTVACSACHVNNNYGLTSANTACVTCHQTDYTNALTPINHPSLGFPTTCDLCHDTVVWTDGTFNHNNTTFPLTGAHTTVACASCHVNNNYTTLPTTCYGCHQTDYTATTNPTHTAAPSVFVTTCQTCHTTTAWTGATFNHTWFPETHGGANSVCATCHTNSTDYTVFQCTGCHTASATTPQHGGVKSYVYNSVNCYQCHPKGNN